MVTSDHPNCRLLLVMSHRDQLWLWEFPQSYLVREYKLFTSVQNP